jgi:hypothetical protein
MYHLECIKEFLKHEILEKKFPLNCPEIKCKTDINYLDLAVLLTKEERR